MDMPRLHQLLNKLNQLPKVFTLQLKIKSLRLSSILFIYASLLLIDGSLGTYNYKCFVYRYRSETDPPADLNIFPIMHLGE